MTPEEQQVEDSVQETHTAVSAFAVEENAGREPDPVKSEEEPVISGETSGLTDPFASLESCFVHIAPGTFAMGSPEYETGRSDDEIMHEVTLTKGFYMMKTTVTQGQWKAVAGDNPSSFLAAAITGLLRTYPGMNARNSYGCLTRERTAYTGSPRRRNGNMRAVRGVRPIYATEKFQSFIVTMTRL